MDNLQERIEDLQRTAETGADWAEICRLEALATRVPSLSDIPAPDWSTVDGVEVLRIEGEPVAALPCSGRRSASRFQVFDVASRECICQLTKREVRGWLVSAAHGRVIDAICEADRARHQAERDAKARAIRAERRARREAQLSFL